MPRTTHAEFASRFTKFRSRLLIGMGNDEVLRYCDENGIDHIDLPMKRWFGLDPVQVFTGRYSHQSWVFPDPKHMLEASRDCDVLETYEAYHLFSGVASDVAWKLSIPLVTEVWTSFRHLAYFVPPYSFVASKVLRRSDLLIARSERAKDALLKFKVDERKIRVLYHGVNLSRFKPRVYRSDKVIFLFVGSMTQEKGVGVLYEAWKQIVKKYKNVEIQLAGIGPLLEMFKDVNNVKVHGWVDHSKLQDIYKNADVFVSVSVDRKIGPFLWWEEFFSYTLMEAQAAGLAIIGSDSGGIPEEIGNDNVVVNQGSVGELVEALEVLIVDTKLRKKLQKNNRKRAERMYDLNKQVEKLEREIGRLL